MATSVLIKAVKNFADYPTINLTAQAGVLTADEKDESDKSFHPFYRFHPW